MSFKIISFLLGRLILYTTGIMCLPLILSIYNEDRGEGAFVVAVFFSFCLATLLFKFGKFDKYKDHLSTREGICIFVLSWILVAAVGSLPYIFSGDFSPVSAFFESVSGFTTTGATVIPNVEIMAPSILLWRSLTQRLGGLGIIMIFIVLLPQLSGSAVQLFNTELGGFTFDKMLPKIRSTTWTILSIYLILTFAETILLCFCGLSVFDAFNHALTTVATGGFSTYNDGLAHFSGLGVQVVVIIFMFLASVNFSLYFSAAKKDWRVFLKDEEFRAYVIMIAVLTVLISLNIALSTETSVGDSIRLAFFHVVSFASTSGFALTNYDAWPVSANFLLTILYFTGACSGSTAGGIKVSRFIILLKIVKAELIRVLHPQMLLKVTYNGRLLSVPQLISINCFFFTYIGAIVLMSLLLAATGVSVNQAIFGVISCLSSVAPGVGMIGGLSNFGGLSAAGQWVLIITMLLGRLEFFTMLVLLRREFWQNSKSGIKINTIPSQYID
jgi:trk system potassium uptake protein TrkH